MEYTLPKTVSVGGREYSIRSDYRAILDICEALTDPELTNEEKAEVLLYIFYPDLADIPVEDWQEAAKQCVWFIYCGETERHQRSAPKLMDWSQDFRYIAAPINRVLGKEIREMEYLHWWTFISAYYEIGDCLFAQIVRIRSLRAKGKPLDKADQQWYQENRELVDLKTSFTEAEDAVINAWLGKK